MGWSCHCRVCQFIKMVPLFECLQVKTYQSFYRHVVVMLKECAVAWKCKTTHITPQPVIKSAPDHQICVYKPVSMQMRFINNTVLPLKWQKGSIDAALLRTHINYCCAIVTSMLTLGLWMLSDCLAQFQKKAEKDEHDLKLAQKCCRSEKLFMLSKEAAFCVSRRRKAYALWHYKRQRWRLWEGKTEKEMRWDVQSGWSGPIFSSINE